MTESAFKGTVLEGRERRYTVLNERDIQKYSSPKWIEIMNRAINYVLEDVEAGREHDGKNPYNSYIVINVDEPYVPEIIEIMKSYGHWEEKKKKIEYQHAEAFCLMTYRCLDCGKEEMLWNSRDGVTPFFIDCKFCKRESQHVNWQKDRRVTDYVPPKGQRIFVDMTDDRKKEIAKKRIEQVKGTDYEVPAEKYDEMLNDIVSGFHEGEPDIIIVD